MAETIDPETEKKYVLIQKLVEQGVLGGELLPEYYYWHWPVLKPDLLPEDLQPDFKNYGEIRLY